MTKRIIKPTLIHVGSHLIDPFDVSCITKIASKNLYIVRLKSQPNMEFPIWVKKHEIDALTKHLNIVSSDIPESE